MKKIAAILLLAILLFNWFGYRVLTAYMEDHADAQLEARLDNGKYDPSELISIKIPASHLSYYSLSNLFQRIDGRVEIKGTWYKYVERRLYNDSLELLCIPNHSAMQLQAAKADFFRLVNDIHSTQSKKSGGRQDVSKSFSQDDYTLHDFFQGSARYFKVSKKIVHYLAAIPFAYASVAENPPELS